MNCRLRIADLNSKIIDEDDFDAFNKDEDNETINYGKDRKILTGKFESEPLNTPFITMPMLEQQFSQIFFTTDNYSINYGIFSTGKQNGSTLRFAVKVDKNSRGQQPKNANGRDRKRNLKREDTGEPSEDSEQNSYDGELSDDSDDALNGRLTVGAPGFGGVGGVEDDFFMTEQEIDELKKRDEAMANCFSKDTTTKIIERL